MSPRVLCGLLVLLAVSASHAAAHTPLTHSATASLSSTRAGARPVALTLELSYEMQCGYPGPGPVVVELPSKERLPDRISAGEVLVDGTRAPTVHLSGHAVTVGLARPPHIMCDEIGPGRVTIVFTRGAGLGNPVHAGSYTIVATRQSSRFSARFTVQ